MPNVTIYLSKEVFELLKKQSQGEKSKYIQDLIKRDRK